MSYERNEQLDKERFNIVVNGNIVMNETPLTHKEACIMKSKLLPSTQNKAVLVSLGYVDNGFRY